MKWVIQFHIGHALDILRTLPGESVQCCITSPPYWGLRDYGEEGQLGLEKTPEEYVANMVEVFSEVKRVLRNDGTLWLNLGDSYASNMGGIGNNPSTKSTLTTNNGKGPKPGDKYATGNKGKATKLDHGLKPKDLVGIPWRVAFALQADGWYLRSDIIWHKPNPMPESVTDRPTKAHEYIFLLSKSERYYYDAEAIKEPAQLWMGQAATFSRSGPVSEHIIPGQSAAQHRQGRHSVKRGGFEGKTKDFTGREAFRAVAETRNKRTVWTIPTHCFAEAHFAVFPPDLIRPCVLAGSRVNDTILDPFGGSGTTLMVANEYGRNGIYIDLSPKYTEMAKKRVGTEQMNLLQLEISE